MRLTCKVTVYDQQLASLNIGQRKGENSVLTLGNFPGKPVYLIHQTYTNHVGVRYKVENNLARIHTKFINEGKVTLKLVEPSIELRIEKCKPLELSKFVKILTNFAQGIDDGSIRLANLATTANKLPPKEQTNLNIQSQKELTSIKSFPRTLTSISIKDAGIRSLDNRILRLQLLRTLNLEGNNLETLPIQLDFLPNLAEISLANNKLGVANKWGWLLNAQSLPKSLVHLNLQANELTFIPGEISKFQQLKSLNVSKNNLSLLPNSLGRLRQLRALDVSANKIKWLPGSIQFLKLILLDLSSNDVIFRKFDSNHNSTNPLTLLDIAAKKVLNSKLNFSDRALLPRELIYYLENASYCQCGKAMFPCTLEAVVPFHHLSITQQLVYSNPQFRLPVAVRSCSKSCSEVIQKRLGPL